MGMTASPQFLEPADLFMSWEGWGDGRDARRLSRQAKRRRCKNFTTTSPANSKLPIRRGERETRQVMPWRGLTQPTVDSAGDQFSVMRERRDATQSLFAS